MSPYHGNPPQMTNDSNDGINKKVSIEICWKCSKLYFFSLDHVKNTLFQIKIFVLKNPALTPILVNTTHFEMQAFKNDHLNDDPFIAWAWKKDRWRVSTVELKSSGLYI